MAEDKKSVVIYTDWIHTFEELTDAQAGRLIKHFFKYINDRNPKPPDKMTKIIFEPIKQQLKRDLQKWEAIRAKRSESGKIGGIKSGESRAIEANEANASKSKQNEANEAVTVNVTVTDTVTVIERENTGPKKFENMIVPEMMKIYKQYFPKYFFDEDQDFPACLAIAYKIAKAKGWKKADIVAGKEKDVLTSWEKIVEFILSDQWFRNRSLTDISGKEWQRLVQQMGNGHTKKEKDDKFKPQEFQYEHIEEQLRKLNKQ